MFMRALKNFYALHTVKQIQIKSFSVTYFSLFKKSAQYYRGLFIEYLRKIFRKTINAYIRVCISG